MIVNMSNYFKLNKDKTVTETSLEEFSKWVAEGQDEDQIVGKDKIGDAEVSTVFLGLDHSFGGGKPVLFETMVFDRSISAGNNTDIDGIRYNTWEEAVKGHNETVIKYGGKIKEVEKIKEDNIDSRFDILDI